MKKEAISTFSGGLNYDLNPITTPADVLTDAVNCTFITFNGDELALQNDAGNTKIKGPNWTEQNPEYVNLTPGFYPLGIKEFGGVLYIVSGKTPSSTLWTAGTYAKDVFVYDSNQTYYKSLINNNTNTLPANTNAFWERLINWNEFANKYGEVEFGSYPSPQNLDEDALGNDLTYTFDNPTKDSLYKSTVLNNNIFKAGEYVIFSGVSDDLSNVTSHKYVNGVRIASTLRIYNVKLYLQLTNGFIDLTEDVWYNYAQFKGGSINDGISPDIYWFNDDDFKYYCKNNFKGKLVVAINLEDLTTYKLNYFELDQVQPGEIALLGEGYKVTFDISINNQTTWNLTHLKLSYSLDGVPVTGLALIPITGSNFTHAISIPFINEGKLFEFEITPVFYKPSGTVDVTSELPDEFLNKHTLSGFELLSTYFNYDTEEYDPEEYY